MAAVDELITENLDIWTSAVKRKASSGRGGGKKLELYGIKKLRELILDLAVRGLLVPQDPEDGPASVLLERIAAEKQRLIDQNSIKRQKTQAPISADEEPFSLPSGWSWCRFGDFLFNRDAERVPLSVDERKTRSGPYDYYGASGVIDSIDDYIFEKPLLLIGEDGANLVNRSTPIAFIAEGRYWVNNHAHVLDGLNIGVLKFTRLHINAISLLPYVTGTAQPKMNQTKMNSIVLAIPPEAEQHRIVAKVDELMALCDQLEQQTESSITAHQTLVQTLLDALTQAAATKPTIPQDDTNAPTPFTQAWNRLAEHFDTVFTTEDSIEQLKQTILQLAVMGKLVPQDPNDEPASVLLERIAAEKAELVKAKKIKKQKALPEIGEEEKPFELREGWEWVRLGQLGYDLGGGTPAKSNKAFWNGEIPWVSPKDMKTDYIVKTQDYVTELAIKETTVKLVPEESLLLVVRGMILAHSFPVAITKTKVVINQDMKALVFRSMLPSFLLLQMKSTKSVVVKLVDRSSHGTCKLSSDKLWNIVIAIPPLEEQERVVARVEELMRLCEQLKKGLNVAQTTQQKLTESLTSHAVQ